MASRLTWAESQGLALQRYPDKHDPSLRAWDGADHIVLEYLSGGQLLRAKQAPAVLAVNDQFGAITCGTNATAVWCDSYMSLRGMALNCQRNDILQPVEFNFSSPIADLKKAWSDIDLCVVKIPKQLDVLVWQLEVLNYCLPDATAIIVAGMDKHTSRSMWQAVEQRLAGLERHRGAKKAHFVTAQTVHNDKAVMDKCLSHYRWDDIELSNFAGVYGASSLDQGSRFFLNQFQDLPSVDRVADLGCGNGVLGIYYQQLNLRAKIDFVDESSAAVASARHNYQQQFLSSKETVSTAEFWHCDCFSAVPAERRYELVLCNPPFHVGNTVTDEIAKQMFAQAAARLTAQGCLMVVGNRHLGYHSLLKRWFSQIDVLVNNPKFVVIKAQL